MRRQPGDSQLSVRAGVLLYLGALLLVATCSAASGPTASPSPGSTTAASADGSQVTQVARGYDLYQANCARCHGVQGEGDIGPKLIGGSNLAGYQTADGLYAYVSKTMPFDKPASLSEQQYLDILAFILERNGLLPETTELTRGSAPDVTTVKQP